MTTHSSTAVQNLSSLGVSNLHKKAVFDYLFGSITNKTFRQSVDDGLALKRELDRSGYILKNCKLYAYAAHMSRLKSGKVVGVRPAEYGVSVEDARFLRTIDLTHIPTKYRAFTLPEFDSIIQSLLESKELNSNIGKFVHKKMRFIYMNSEKSYQDLCSSLLAEALYGVYRAYPKYQSFLHMINIAKTCLRNYGHTLIRNHGLQASRATMLSLNSIPVEAFAKEVAMSDTMQDHPGSETASSSYLYSKLLEESKSMSAKGRTFLHISFGLVHEEFSSYLGMPNDQAMDKMSSLSYQRNVRKFLHITEEQVSEFFATVRERTGISI